MKLINKLINKINDQFSVLLIDQKVDLFYFIITALINRSIRRYIQQIHLHQFICTILKLIINKVNKPHSSSIHSLVDNNSQAININNHHNPKQLQPSITTTNPTYIQKMFIEQIDESELKSMRLREVLIMMVGYAVSEINFLLRTRVGLTNRNEKQNIVNNTLRIGQLVNQLIDQMDKNTFATKIYLVRLFQTALQLLCEQMGGKIHSDNIYQVFRLLIVEGLNAQYLQKDVLVVALNTVMSRYICTKHNTNHDKLKKSRIKEFLQSQQQSTQSMIGVCDICMCPFQSIPTHNSKNTFFTLSQCKHQFHHKCLIQMIKHYINTRNDIIFFPQQTHKKPSQQSQTITKQKQIVTKIKCPNFQSCSVYFNLQEIHQLILEVDGDGEDGQLIQNDKYLLLDKIYQLTFNDYLVNKGTRTIYELKEKFQKQKDSLKDQQSSIMFYCNTLGCNAIYEIDTTTPDKSTTLICFSCKSIYCLKCFSTIHPTMTCKQYLISTSTLPQDQQLQKFIKTLKKPYKRCPKCKFYVDNWRGCSTVKCRCGIEFCFKCGNIGCPHAKCINQIEKEEKGKLKLQQKQRQLGNKDKDQERV